MKRTARSMSVDNTSATYRDRGYGDSVADSVTSRDASRYSTSNSLNVSASATDGGGSRAHCAYDYNVHFTRGQSQNLAVIGASRTASTEESTHYEKTTSSMQEETLGNTSGTRKFNSISRNNGTSFRVSSSYFYALVDSVDRGAGESHSTDVALGYREADAQADGGGTSTADSKTKAETSSQGTNESLDVSSMDRFGDTVGASFLDEVKSGQRFKHLMALYDNVNELIIYKRRQLRARVGAQIGYILTKSLDGFCEPWAADCNQGRCWYGYYTH